MSHNCSIHVHSLVENASILSPVMCVNTLQMTTAISIEDVRREVRILNSLTRHRNLVQFYDAYEDEDNVYIVME